MLPSFLQSCLPSYELESLEVKRDKKLIITQVLNYGDDKALRWLGKNYSAQQIKEVVFLPTRGMWAKSVLSYWLRIFNLRLPEKLFNKAIIDLNRF